MFQFKKIILRPSDTLSAAIDVLDKEAQRLVMVADGCGKLLGTVTDGDIRRALLRQLDMNSSLQEVMSSNPITANSSDSRNSIRMMMKRNDILHIPILSSDGVIVGLETLQSLTDVRQIDNPVVLMAGGFGKRLQPLTNETPKPLLHVGGKPILETILSRFVDYGFSNFFISTHYKADMLQDYFGDGSQWNVTIQYLHESQPMGTAGALGLLPSGLPDRPLIVMNGDLLTKVDFVGLLEFHEERGGDATICVREYDFQLPYGVVTTSGDVVTSIVEKPVHKFFVNAGIYVLNPSVVSSVTGDEYFDMPKLLEKEMARGKRVNTFPVHEYWLDIGRIEQYEQAQDDCGSFFKC